MTPLTPMEASPEQDLHNWWVEKATADADKVVPKAIEYGAVDLEIMGASLEQMMPQLAEDGNSLGREAAVAFYVLGKIARIISALEDGRQPDIDSWFDICVYGQIAQYEREGTWPGL